MDERSRILSTRQIRLRPTPKLGVLNNVVKIVLMKQDAWPEPVRLGFWLTLIVFALLLTGCAAPSILSSEPARNPMMPQPVASQPSEAYLIRVERNMKQWDEKLRSTLPTR